MTIKELENNIKDANWAYWVDCNPTISDFEYDKLVEELRKLDPENPLINAFTFVGTERKVIHTRPMLSLDKAYSVEEIMKWVKRVARSKDEKIYVMPKYDGLSGKFENGKLSSRGDGKVGQDYTDRLPLIKFKTTNRKRDILLGEMLITNEDFKKMELIKTKSGIPFKNQRNAAAGIIGCDDIDFYVKQGVKITFVDYDTLRYEMTVSQLEANWTKIVEAIQKLPYPMDGIVIKLKDIEYYDSLGNTEHAPRGAIAFKYTNQAKWTKLIGVEWTMGKDQLACVGQVEPIDITGTTIKNVKLQVTKPVASNVTTYLIDGSLQIGDHVLIERAGDIIPHVKESKPGDARQLVEVKTCPFCGSPLNVTETIVACSNDECEEKLIQRLYFSMITLGFKGIGEVYARSLFKLLNVKTVNDLMNVKREDLIKHNEFGNKMIDIFLEEQKKVRSVSPEQFLVSMNVPSLGKNVSKILMKEYPFDMIINGELTYSEMIKLKGIGPIAAEDVSKGLRMRKDEFLETSKHFNFKQNSVIIEDIMNDKLKICFTGKMEHKRSDMERLAFEHGYEPVDHIDKITNILVCADPNGNSSKLIKARKQGIKIISELDFYKSIN